MKYLDNLTSWADFLFRQDRPEAIDEAVQLYLLASEILGPRPQEVQNTSNVKRKYADLKDQLEESSSSNPLSNPTVSVLYAENIVSRTYAAFPIQSSMNTNIANLGSNELAESLSDTELQIEAPDSWLQELQSHYHDHGGLLQLQTANIPYFCIPHNEKLLSYWDNVARQLEKIRQGRNIEGKERPLSPFEPPIEPGALTMGIDLRSLGTTLSPYRFTVMVQKAAELCAEVKALGAALLSVLEKRDAEALALLRSSHEITVLEMMKSIKDKQYQEAQETWNSLKASKKTIEARSEYYDTLVREGLNFGEELHLQLLAQSLGLQATAAGLQMGASMMRQIPNFEIGVPTTVGATGGGMNMGAMLQDYAAFINSMSSIVSTGASMASTVGGYKRREAEWEHQIELAEKELEQMEYQIKAAQIRLEAAKEELDVQNKQIDHAKAVDRHMRTKYTNQDLYNWMVGQISSIYFQSYKLAYDIARRAEQAYRYELATDANFIQFGYWDSLKKGLLAGEKLLFDLKRMEISYLEQHKREYELTKHISLNSFNPIALEKLKTTGACFIDIPEWLFDVDYPGHYLRRIKSISLTIPCVTGPYTSVSATLTLQSNRIRKENDDEFRICLVWGLQR